MDIVSLLVGAAIVGIMWAIYKDRQDTKARDEAHNRGFKRALNEPKYRLKVTTTLGEIYHSDYFRAEHNPGPYSWIMTSKENAESAADYAVRKGIKVAGRYLPACSIHDIQLESNENKLEE